MYTQAAETMWNTLIEILEYFLATFKVQQPRLSKIVLLDENSLCLKSVTYFVKINIKKI
jgi:hypothetical protein